MANWQTSLLLLGTLLAGCGQTGPLYLPEPEPAALPEQPEETPETGTIPLPDT